MVRFFLKFVGIAFIFLSSHAFGSSHLASKFENLKKEIAVQEQSDAIRKRQSRQRLEEIKQLCRETNFAKLPQRTLINLAKSWGVPLRSISFVRIDFNSMGCDILFDTDKGVRNVEGYWYFIDVFVEPN